MQGKRFIAITRHGNACRATLFPKRAFVFFAFAYRKSLCRKKTVGIFLVDLKAGERDNSFGKTEDYRIFYKTKINISKIS